VTVQLLVLAKAPVPGRVKTRLCPPCTHEQAAAVAAAALADTLVTVTATPASRRLLVHTGHHPAPPGWEAVPQRGEGLGERLANAFADAARPGVFSLLVGMDTPQMTPTLLTGLAVRLKQVDAVLAPAWDGGWWALGLRDPGYARVLAGVPMSTPDTCHHTEAALRAAGLRVDLGPWLRDVDTATDAWAVAGEAPAGRFAEAVRRHVPVAVSR
jgi:rSAM/selenodomain-associated transferase 1